MFRRPVLIALVFLSLIFLGESGFGVSYTQLGAKSLVTINSPNVQLQSGTSGTNTIYVNSTSASSRVSTYSTYYPGSYNVTTGSYVSGTLPASVQTVDSNYFVVSSAGNSGSTGYNPNAYNLLGSTTASTGTVSNLAANDSVFFNFKSYPTQFSSTSLSVALGEYRSTSGSGVNYPSTRFWDGSTWGSEAQLTTAGSPIRWVRSVYSPLGGRFNETIVVTLSDNGNLNAYVYNGTSWALTSNIASVGTVVNAYRAYDITYETSTGRAFLAYSLPGGNHRIGYEIWNGASWSAETTFNMESSAGDVQWVEMASNPGSSSSEILIATLASTLHVDAVIWNGASLGNLIQITTTGATASYENIAVNYEQTSGKGMVVFGSGTDVWSIRWSGSAWDSSNTDVANQSPNWLVLKSDPSSGSNNLMELSINSGSAYAVEWTGSGWGSLTTLDNGGVVCTFNTRCLDFAWEPTGSKGLVVWSHHIGQIRYRTFASGAWGTATNSGMGTNAHSWVTLRRNPRTASGDALILGMVQEDTSHNIGAIKWDGTTFTVIGASTFTSNTGTDSYLDFDFAFRRFGTPTQYTSGVEFTGSSDTQTWTQLQWSLESAWDTASATVTIQLYNFTSASYPSSGSGYDTYTSGTANQDQGRSQTITSGMTTFRDASGNWKMKVTGVKSTGTMFQFKADWVEFRPTSNSQPTATTEFIITGITSTTPASLNFTIVSTYTVGSVTVTIQAYNHTGSSYVTSGGGYATYSSAASPTNETQVLSITLNPTQYISAGQAKVRVKGTTSSTSFQQKTNLLLLNDFTDNTFDYVLKVVNQAGSSWNIRLSRTSDSNIGRGQNYTLYFHDGSTSRQIYINSGAYSGSTTGPWFTLAASSTDYIAIRAISSNVGTTVINVNLEIRSPTSAPTIQFPISFTIN